MNRYAENGNSTYDALSIVNDMNTTRNFNQRLAVLIPLDGWLRMTVAYHACQQCHFVLRDLHLTYTLLRNTGRCYNQECSNCRYVRNAFRFVLYPFKRLRTNSKGRKLGTAVYLF